MYLKTKIHDTSCVYTNLYRTMELIGLDRSTPFPDSADTWLNDSFPETFTKLFVNENILNALEILNKVAKHYRRGYDNSGHIYKAFLSNGFFENVFWLAIADELNYLDKDVAEIKIADYKLNEETKQLITSDHSTRYEFVFLTRRRITSEDYRARSVSDMISELDEQNNTFENLSSKNKFYNDDKAHYYKINDRIFVRIKNNKYRYILLNKIGSYYFDYSLSFNERTKTNLEKFKNNLLPFLNDGDLIELYDESLYEEEIESIIATINDFYEKYFLYCQFTRDDEKYLIKEKYYKYINDLNTKIKLKNALMKEFNQLETEVSLLEQAQNKNVKSESDKVIETLERYKRFNIVNKYEISEDSRDELNIVIETKPIQIQFFEDFRARSYLNSLTSTIESIELEIETYPGMNRGTLLTLLNRVNYCKNLKDIVLKVLSGEDYKIFMTPHILTIKLREDSIGLETSSHIGHRMSNVNPHACYNSGRGCRGTFDEEFSLYSKTYEVDKFLKLYFQYIQSINPTDPIGHNAFDDAYVTNSDNIIISGSIPNFNGKFGYKAIGRDIYEFFNSVKGYSDDNYVASLEPDYSKLKNQDNVYKRIEKIEDPDFSNSNLDFNYRNYIEDLETTASVINQDEDYNLTGMITDTNDIYYNTFDEIQRYMEVIE